MLSLGLRYRAKGFGKLVSLEQACRLGGLIMMRDAVRGVLDAEATAKQLVKEAEQEARRIVACAREAARARTEDLARLARIDADAIVALKKEKAETKRKELLHTAQERIQKELQIPEEVRRHAVEESVRVIFKIP